MTNELRQVIGDGTAEMKPEVPAPQSGRSETGGQYVYSMPQIDWSNALTDQVRTAIGGFFDEVNRIVENNNRTNQARYDTARAKGNVSWQPHLMSTVTPHFQDKLCEYVANPGQRGPGDYQLNVSYYLIDGAWRKLAAADGMTPVAVLTIGEFLFRAWNDYTGINYQVVDGINAYRQTHNDLDLLTLSLIVQKLGADPANVLRCYCAIDSFSVGWPADAAWPYFAHHAELVNRFLLATDESHNFRRANLFKAIATLPWPHEATIGILFDLALGTGKTERAAAQRALANHAGKESRIAAALAHSKAEVRTVAARWLQELGWRGAIPELEAAVAREKNDVAKGALLDTLERFGQPLEKYLDRAALQKEAVKALAKGLPKDFEWFPWSVIPAVRWADNGEQVSAEVLRLLLVQAVKQKTAEPNVILRKFCGLFDAHDRERFGQFVLEAWLQEDTKPIPLEEAEKNARQWARQVLDWMQRAPQHYRDGPLWGKSEDELFAHYLPANMRVIAGSAIASKGVLAVAAACATERAVAPVGRYLKEYYGMRAAQCKALVVMLAWIEHPSATQLMLSVGNRFRTKSIQEEATQQAHALAERRGWSLAELADRTIPSGGFDETGTLELSYGERSFIAKLLPDFKIELFNPEGKKIAALSEPRADDDVEQAKASKQALSSAKKEIKNIVTLQTERLHEALCTERDWPFADWDIYLNRHAIVRRLLQRLVWAQVENGQVVRTFRPLDDGTLTDVEDNEVELPGDARVRLAHDTILPPDVVAAWRSHLTDYDVAPLFQQLGKGTYTLPEGRAGQKLIKDFEGYLLESFALRGRATKLGYARGSTGDGGWFYTYEKRFPTLGIVAVIEFSGNGLPEENRTVALLALSFRSTDDKASQRHGMILGGVPKVLLSECYSDLSTLAAEGGGFDPEWEKKSSY